MRRGRGGRGRRATRRKRRRKEMLINSRITIPAMRIPMGNNTGTLHICWNLDEAPVDWQRVFVISDIYINIYIHTSICFLDHPFYSYAPSSNNIRFDRIQVEEKQKQIDNTMLSRTTDRFQCAQSVAVCEFIQRLEYYGAAGISWRSINSRGTPSLGEWMNRALSFMIDRVLIRMDGMRSDASLTRLMDA